MLVLLTIADVVNKNTVAGFLRPGRRGINLRLCRPASVGLRKITTGQWLEYLLVQKEIVGPELTRTDDFGVTLDS